MIVSARPAESTHWYTLDGEPMYTVVGSNGKERPTTLRDARKMSLVPSVTTILNVASKPALMQWMQRQVLMAALTLPKRDNEPEEEYIDRIIQDSKEQGKAAADAGTDIHSAIQRYYETGVVVSHMEHVLACRGAIDKHFGNLAWKCEKSFAHDMGFGGKVDMHSGDVVIDIKTKEFTDPKEVKPYDEHLMQLAAYRVGLGMVNAKCANVFISRNKPGLVHIHEWKDEELVKGWSMFSSLLSYWQEKNDYQPSL